MKIVFKNYTLKLNDLVIDFIDRTKYISRIRLVYIFIQELIKGMIKNRLLNR